MNLINLTEEAGLKPKRVASTQGGEYHSSCPSCGGNDRFIIQPNKQMSKCIGYYFCRKCDIQGDTIQFCRDFLGYENFRDAVEHTGATISGPERINAIPKLKLLKQTNPIVPPPAAWSDQAKKLVAEAHENLLCKLDSLEYLQKRGLPLEAVKAYQLGLLATDKYESGALWELPEKEAIWIPAGLVIPFTEHSRVIVRLKIRCFKDTLPKYVAISGSMNGFTIIGNKKGYAMIIVESELDAYAIGYVAGDFLTIVATGGSSKNPDPVTDALAKKHANLLICHDNDDAGRIMLTKWQQLYPHARPDATPYGKDIGEALQQGLGLREWLIDALPDTIQSSLLRPTPCWNKEDQEIINWFKSYVHQLEVAHVPSRPAYTCFEKEIALGPESPRAKTGELQNGLRLMRRLVE